MLWVRLSKDLNDLRNMFFSSYFEQVLVIQCISQFFFIKEKSKEKEDLGIVFEIPADNK